MYKYGTLTFILPIETRYWQTVPSKIDILLDDSFFYEIMYWRNPKNLCFLKLDF